MSEEGEPPDRPARRMSRREWLAAAAVAGGAGMVGGIACSPEGKAAAPAPPSRPQLRHPRQRWRLPHRRQRPPRRHRWYRTLGRTGLRVSEIGFGGFPIDDPEVLVYALERGINYVDTSHFFRGGASERAIGQALRPPRQVRRDHQVVSASHRQRAAEAGLSRHARRESAHLDTDYVDIVLNHEVGRDSDDQGVDRLRNPEMLAAWDAAKQAGKARFLGASGHDGDLPAVMGYAIDSGSSTSCSAATVFSTIPSSRS